MWCIPPEQNADFSAKMEDVLDVYTGEYDEKFPVICLDEKPHQLPDDVREPLKMKPGSPEKTDSEYRRCGTCSIFVMTEPLTGWRHAHARERRTAVDFAHEIDSFFTLRPDVPKIRLVMDNLNTHFVSSLYKAFPAPKARELAKKLEIHYTPRHGSWLNMAENAVSVLSSQCTGRRIADIDTLNSEIAAWERQANASPKKVDWRFTTEDAGIKLKRLYPIL